MQPEMRLYPYVGKLVGCGWGDDIVQGGGAAVFVINME